MGEERILLKDGIDVALVWRNGRYVDSVQQNLTRRRPFEAGNHFQDCGLAASRRPEHGEELAGVDSKIGIVNGREISECLADAPESNDLWPSDASLTQDRLLCPISLPIKDSSGTSLPVPSNQGTLPVHKVHYVAINTGARNSPRSHFAPGPTRSLPVPVGCLHGHLDT